MSRLTNIRKTSNNKEFGNQTYRAGADFATQMRVATEKARAQISDVRESEMVRPYVSDSYEEMEYYLIPEAGMYSVPTADIAELSLRYDVPWTDPYVGESFEGYWAPLPEIGISTFVGTFRPAVSGDDGHWASVLYRNNLTTVLFGMTPGGAVLHNWVRFPNDIPKGATILSAAVGFLATGTQTEDYINVKVHFNAADAAVAPTSIAEGDALSLTTGVAWSAVNHWTGGVWYSAPPLKDDLQAVIDRPGRKSGDAVMFVLKDNGTGYPPTPVRQYWSIDQGSSVAAQLQVIWEI